MTKLQTPSITTRNFEVFDDPLSIYKKRGRVTVEFEYPRTAKKKLENVNYFCTEISCLLEVAISNFFSSRVADHKDAIKQKRA